LCMSGTLADVYFVFPSRGEQQDSLPASEVIVRDMRTTTFRTILRYIYTDNVEFDGNTVMHVLYAARKYALEPLVAECEHFLQTAIDVNNVCSLFNQASFYQMDLLQCKCLDFICMNANDVFLTDDFLQLTPLSLNEILKAGALGVEEELDVFKAAVRWAKHHCEKKGFEPTPTNQRAWLAEVLYRIRLPIIPVAEFTSVVVESELLTSEEQLQLYKHMTSHRNPDTDEEMAEKIGKFEAKHRPGNNPLRLRKVSLFYSPTRYEQNISVAVTNMKDRSLQRPRLEPVPERGPISLAESVYLEPNTQYNVAVTCMVYCGDVKALEYTDTLRGVLVNISSVFNSISSLHLSRVHS
ncbi:BTB6B-like protein, partial [Mya arenaria]